MKPTATQSKSGSSSSSRRHRYTKVCDNRKHPIRGLWRRNGKGDRKNREARRVDFNAELEAHLKAMHARRAPNSQWLFPSPQRGDRDDRSKIFRESLLLTRAVSGCVCQDCKQITFGAQTPTACPQCQSIRLESKEKVLPNHLQKFGFHDCRHHFIST